MIKNRTTTRLQPLFILLQVAVFSSPTAFADYAELLEECGGHTNYGLAADTVSSTMASEKALPDTTVSTYRDTVESAPDSVSSNRTTVTGQQ